MSTTPRLRKPTGKIGYPAILAEGEQGAGKTYWALALAADPRIGDVVAIDFGEACVDEYGPLGPFQVLDHNGTVEDLTAQVRALVATMPAENSEGRPNAIVFDGSSSLWDDAKNRAEDSARQRGKTRRDGELIITMDQWNAANRRFYGVLMPLLEWGGVVIITARGREVAEVGPNGQPTGAKDWAPEVQKRLPFLVSAHLRFRLPRKLEAVKVRSLKLALPTNGFLDLTGVTAGQFIFDKLGVEGPASRRLDVTDQVTVAVAKTELLEAVGGDKSRAGELWNSSPLANAGGFVKRADVDALIASAKVPSEPPAGERETVEAPLGAAELVADFDATVAGGEVAA